MNNNYSSLKDYNSFFLVNGIIFKINIVGVIGLEVHIYVYIRPGAQSEDNKCSFVSAFRSWNALFETEFIKCAFGKF